MKKPIAFFDRDGVLNADIGYLWRKEDFAWTPGAVEAIRYLREQGYLIVVVTNQSGVARGFYDEKDVVALHTWMNQQLDKDGASIDAFSYCPHYREGSRPEYIIDCQCRKPLPGMLLKAFADLPGDRSQSFLNGDRDSDLQAAAAAGLPGYLFTGGNLADFVRTTIQEVRTA